LGRPNLRIENKEFRNEIGQIWLVLFRKLVKPHYLEEEMAII
jgi:hypothetical protein